jgi:hypothetical protein
MGLNTWAAFVGTQEDAAIAGDVAMLENEVPPVLKSTNTFSFSMKYPGKSDLRSSAAVAGVKQVSRSVPEFWRALQPVRRQISSLYA